MKLISQLAFASRRGNRCISQSIHELPPLNDRFLVDFLRGFYWFSRGGPTPPGRTRAKLTSFQHRDYRTAQPASWNAAPGRACCAKQTAKCAKIRNSTGTSCRLMHWQSFKQEDRFLVGFVHKLPAPPAPPPRKFFGGGTPPQRQNMPATQGELGGGPPPPTGF